MKIQKGKSGGLSMGIFGAGSKCVFPLVSSGALSTLISDLSLTGHHIQRSITHSFFTRTARRNQTLYCRLGVCPIRPQSI